jgi:hypothetical protein
MTGGGQGAGVTGPRNVPSASYVLRDPPCGARVADPHAEPHGVPERDPRPARERAPLPGLVVGYPAENASVPAITTKPLADIATFV